MGRALLERLIEASEAAGIRTLQSGIFPENGASLASPPPASTGSAASPSSVSSTSWTGRRTVKQLPTPRALSTPPAWTSPIYIPATSS